MQLHNLWKADIVDEINSTSMKDTIAGIIENSGVEGQYYLYDEDIGNYRNPIAVSVYLDAGIFSNEFDFRDEKIKSDKRFTAIIATEYFRLADKRPTKKDKLKINDEEYFINGVVLYDKNKHVALFDESVLVSLFLIKRTAFTRNTMMQ